VELPAGLIDDGETPEEAAIRELREETGYKAEGALESSAVLATDPGLTTANMKLVILDVPLDGEMESPDQNLEHGEAIVRRTVEVKNLCALLKEYEEKKDHIIDARLLHLAAGFDLAERLRTGVMAS
jgi:ADP-ribose pyrophosphatase